MADDDDDPPQRPKRTPRPLRAVVRALLSRKDVAKWVLDHAKNKVHERDHEQVAPDALGEATMGRRSLMPALASMLACASAGCCSTSTGGGAYDASFDSSYDVALAEASTLSPCSQSVEAGCAQCGGGCACYPTWEAAGAIACLPLEGVGYHPGECGQYDVLGVSFVDTSEEDFYDKADGALVAVLYTNLTMGHFCLGGPPAS